MKKKIKAIININGSNTVLDCPPNIAIEGQKVMLVRTTDELVKGHVSGRNLGVKENVIGVGRVNNGIITIESNAGPLSVKLENAEHLTGMRAKKRFSLKKAKSSKCNNVIIHRKQEQNLALKAIKD